MKPRPPCRVDLCVSTSSARRIVCPCHARAHAFTMANQWLCLSCATNRVRNGQATRLLVVDDQAIDERNRLARTAGERAACGQCGRCLAGAPRARRLPAHPRARQAALELPPPPPEMTR